LDLLNSETCIIHNDLANDVLKQYVTQYSILYGNECVTYNVLGLIHLSDFLKVYGSLENFSAFKNIKITDYEKYSEKFKESASRCL